MGCNICKQQLGNEEQQEIKANIKKPQEKINVNNNNNNINNDFHTNSNGLMNSNYYNNNFNSEKSPSINGLSSKFYDESSNNGKFKVTANFNNEVDSNFISHNNIYSNNSNSLNNNNNNNGNNNNNNLISFSKENNNNNNKNVFNNNNNNNDNNNKNYNSNEKIIEFNSNNNNYDILSQNSNQINPKTNNNKEIIKSSIPIDIENNNNEKISTISYDPNLEPNDEFSRYIFHELNNIRQNPQNYIDLITKSESNILKDKKNRLIYKSKVKVALNKGLPSFEETINFLKNLQPMNRLYYLPKLTVDIPTTEEEIKDKNYLKVKVGEKIEEGINIKSYWRDIINDAETSFLLMIVDDTGMKPGMKRKNIFDSNMKFIGISSISINKYFACYIVFSDRDN